MLKVGAMSLHGRLRGGNDRRPITVQTRDWIVIGFYIARNVIGFYIARIVMLVTLVISPVPP